ncbi:hypothetical protein HZH66_009832 [Vespula vulgaris]|uniref:Uncharacterized protein n=1 Tax=Vespula vulgaris TaxID=7454 RepID=A0A834MZY5_VESVU|nr:hypothetical protein HZH66_009832 [Vespula vulgaris]
MIKNAETIAEEDNNENGRKRNIPTSSEMEATHLRTDSPARSETHENEDNEEYETAIFTLATFAAGAARYPRLLDFPSSLGNLFNLTGHETGETLPLESHASERVMLANFIPKYTNRRQLAMQVELPQADHQTLVYVGYLGD